MYDVIIIGAGPAGISASLYTKRANLNTLVIYKDNSALEKAKKIENYYGFQNGIDGKKLYQDGIKQARELGVDLVEDEVIDIKIENNLFKVQTLREDYISKSLILATGNKKNKPNIKGIEKLEGKGISYCAICDGFFFKNKNVAVIGNGNYAISETRELFKIVKNVTILSNGNIAPEFRADNVNKNSKRILEIEGNEKVEKIRFEDGTSLNIDGVFIAEGVAGSTEFAKKLGLLTKNEKIIVDDSMQTSMKGLFACGDCIGGLYQISKAVYEGTKAGLSVINYIRGGK